MDRQLAALLCRGWIVALLTVAGCGGPQGGTARRERRAATQNLKALSLALVMYAADNDQYLPSMKSVDDAQEALLPYLGAMGMQNVEGGPPFTDPETGESFGVNPTLTYKGISAYAEAVTFYAERPARDGKRGVALACGRVLWVGEDEWAKRKAESQLP